MNRTEFNRTRYQKARAEGRCVACGLADSRTEGGRAYCRRCALRQAEASRRFYAKKTAKKGGPHGK